MDEYISKQDAVDAAMQYCPDDDGTCSKADKDIRELLDEIEDIPAADVAPVRHGKWIFRSDVYGVAYCSECDYEIHGNDTYYCPYCGAKMDGEETS